MRTRRGQCACCQGCLDSVFTIAEASGRQRGPLNSYALEVINSDFSYKQSRLLGINSDPNEPGRPVSRWRGRRGTCAGGRDRGGRALWGWMMLAASSELNGIFRGDTTTSWPLLQNKPGQRKCSSFLIEDEPEVFKWSNRQRSRQLRGISGEN